MMTIVALVAGVWVVGALAFALALGMAASRQMPKPDLAGVGPLDFEATAEPQAHDLGLALLSPRLATGSK